MNQASFEDSLRNSQLNQSSPRKLEQQLANQKNKKVQFLPDDINEILNILSPSAQQGPKQVVKPKVAKGKLDFIFNPTRDITAQKPYHEDGDSNMYTDQAIELRQRLKADPDIQSAINEFMLNYKFDQKDKLVKDDYLFVQIRLANILRDDLVEDENLDELRFTLNADWEHDSLGKGFMSKLDLYNSLFELVDIWTPDADKDEYIGFFELISERFQYYSEEKIERKFYEFIGENTV